MHKHKMVLFYSLKTEQTMTLKEFFNIAINLANHNIIKCAHNDFFCSKNKTRGS